MVVDAHHCGFPGAAASAIEAAPITATVTLADPVALIDAATGRGALRVYPVMRLTTVLFGLCEALSRPTRSVEPG